MNSTVQESKRSVFMGLPLDLLTMQESVLVCEALIESRQFAQHVVVNAAKLVASHDDRVLARSIGNADIVNADGQSVVWAARAAGIRVPERVAGIDLMDRLVAMSAERSWPVYLLGASQEVLDAVSARFASQYPAFSLAGSQNGFFDDDCDAARRVEASGARILLIAMPSPKKERFVEAHRDRLGRLLVVGVGGSFDVVAGVTRRAPRWMQRAGLEWLFRVVQEPARMWRRYLIGNTRFIMLALREIIVLRAKRSRAG